MLGDISARLSSRPRWRACSSISRLAQHFRLPGLPLAELMGLLSEPLELPLAQLEAREIQHAVAKHILYMMILVGLASPTLEQDRRMVNALWPLGQR
jgi:hypothetical protein